MTTNPIGAIRLCKSCFIVRLPSSMFDPSCTALCDLRVYPRDVGSSREKNSACVSMAVYLVLQLSHDLVRRVVGSRWATNLLAGPPAYEWNILVGNTHPAVDLNPAVDRGQMLRWRRVWPWRPRSGSARHDLPFGRPRGCNSGRGECRSHCRRSLIAPYEHWSASEHDVVAQR